MPSLQRTTLSVHWVTANISERERDEIGGEVRTIRATLYSCRCRHIPGTSSFFIGSVAGYNSGRLNARPRYPSSEIRITWNDCTNPNRGHRRAWRRAALLALGRREISDQPATAPCILDGASDTHSYRDPISVLCLMPWLRCGKRTRCNIGGGWSWLYEDCIRCFLKRERSKILVRPGISGSTSHAYPCSKLPGSPVVEYQTHEAER